MRSDAGHCVIARSSAGVVPWSKKGLLGTVKRSRACARQARPAQKPRLSAAEGRQQSVCQAGRRVGPERVTGSFSGRPAARGCCCMFGRQPPVSKERRTLPSRPQGGRIPGAAAAELLLPRRRPQPLRPPECTGPARPRPFARPAFPQAPAAAGAARPSACRAAAPPPGFRFGAAAPPAAAEL